MRRVVLFWWFAACGGDDTTIGLECGINNPVCSGDESCNTNVLGGYCTISCSVRGSSAECPGGSICENVTSLGGAYCVRICEDVGDCGRNGVVCEPVTATTLKACKPN
jgi:hypothetical protein